MRKIVFTSHTGYCGMDGHDFDVYPDDVSDEELDTIAYEYALQNAESFGIYPVEWNDEDEDEDAGGARFDSDKYSENIDGWWEDYDPEKHDGLSTTSFNVSEYFANAEEP